MPAPPDNQPKGVTVAVPTLNRGADILPTLTDLLAQTHRPLEVLVVDQSSEIDPEVLALARANADILSLHHVAFRGLPQARNYAIQHARYDVLLFVDDDTRIPDNLIAEHLRALSLPGVGLVAGAVDEPLSPLDAGPPTGTYNRRIGIAIQGYAATFEGDVDHAKGCNFSASKHVLLEFGGFDEALGRGAAQMEEVECCLRVKRAGYRVFFNGRARLTHLPAPRGGCRVGSNHSLILSVMHNNLLTIRRHLRPHEQVTAVARHLRIVAGFARAERSPALFLGGLRACWEGWRQGAKAPVFTVRELELSGAQTAETVR